MHSSNYQEGFDLNTNEFRGPIKEMLEERGWKVSEVLLETKYK